MKTTTVRVNESTRTKLRLLSEQTGQSMQTVLDSALDAFRREQFFAALNHGYAALWADPAVREQELSERRLFEGTLADDLEED